MSKYFTSDWHLYHIRSLGWPARSEFNGIDDMNAKIIHNMITSIPINSELYFIGDLSWVKDYIDYVLASCDERHIKFHWILGNHDEPTEEQKKKCASVSSLKEIRINKKTIVMCHYPMTVWNKSHYNAWHLYGHIHAGMETTDKIESRMSGKSLNVNCEFHDFKPWSEKELEEYMATRPDNFDFIEHV
jgi:calcineurin-like phosphoesterase family protein